MEQACLMNEDVSDKSTRTSSLCWNHCWLQYYMLLSLSFFCFYSSLLFHFSVVWKWHNVKQKERESERNKMKHIMPIYNYIYHSVCKLLLILSNSNLKNNWEVEGRNLHFILLNNFKKKTIFESHLWTIQLPLCCIYKVERLVCGFSVADS